VTTVKLTTGTAVFLVVDPLGGPINWAGVDRVRAHELARNTGQLVVELAAQADYRSTEDRRFDEEGGARS
jgi:hypothetical protein